MKGEQDEAEREKEKADKPEDEDDEDLDDELKEEPPAVSFVYYYIFLNVFSNKITL